MRISDWSSDVCSSDLSPWRDHNVARYQHPDRIAGTDGQRGLDVELAADDLLPGLVERILPAVADGAGDIVIGVRAHLGADTEQGRERGCAGEDRKSTRLNSSH